MARVAVVGSCNVDLVFRAPRRPQAGETLAGTAFHTFVGGKGANQAIAAARAGAAVDMVGRLGAEAFGQSVLEALQREGIGVAHVAQDPEAGTGVAGIVVEPGGANSIVVVPQANARLSVEDVEQAREAIGRAGVLLLQLETPVEASLAAARIARRAGATVVLNPAPARNLPASLLEVVDVLTPNEPETEQLSHLPARTSEEAERAARALLATGVKAVLLTLGERGAMVVDAAGAEIVPPYAVQAVDTTAAGDAFCGALAVALAEGRPMREAARFACAAGALAVTVMGAGPSLPTRPAIDALMQTR